MDGCALARATVRLLAKVGVSFAPRALLATGLAWLDRGPEQGRKPLGIMARRRFCASPPVRFRRAQRGLCRFFAATHRHGRRVRDHRTHAPPLGLSEIVHDLNYAALFALSLAVLTPRQYATTFLPLTRVFLRVISSDLPTPPQVGPGRIRCLRRRVGVGVLVAWLTTN